MSESHPRYDYLKRGNTPERQWCAWVRLVDALDAAQISWETLDDGESVDVWNGDTFVACVTVDVAGVYVIISDYASPRVVTPDVDVVISKLRE